MWFCRYLLQDISGSEGETAREDDRRFREHTAVRLARASDCQETLGRVGSLRQSPGLPVDGPLTAGHDGQLVTQGNRDPEDSVQVTADLRGDLVVGLAADVTPKGSL